MKNNEYIIIILNINNNWNILLFMYYHFPFLFDYVFFLNYFMSNHSSN